MNNQTSTFVPCDPSQNVIGCKWTFSLKRNPDGAIARHKSRVVAKGFHQHPCIDFSDTFSPVVKPATVCCVLSLAVTHDWYLQQLDVNNAFLQGILSYDDFIYQPLSFIHLEFSNHVYKL